MFYYQKAGDTISSYNYKDNFYEFDGDLTKYLISQGVGQDYILKMKNKILESDYRKEYYIPEYKTCLQIIPLEKVIGTKRSEPGLSVYENVRCMESGQREPSRFIKCFKYLENLGLDNLKLSYQNLENPIKAKYYKDEDKYFISSDGNHRSLVAMLVGAKGIKAKVSYYRIDYEKKCRYELFNQFKKKYSIKYVYKSLITVDILFEDKIGIYEINGFSKNFDNKNFNKFIEELSIQIDKDKKMTYIISKLPMSMKQLYFKFTNNYRIKQYIEKRYLNEKEIQKFKLRTTINDIYSLWDDKN